MEVLKSIPLFLAMLLQIIAAVVFGASLVLSNPVVVSPTAFSKHQVK